MAKREVIQTDPFGKKIVRSVYFQMILLLLLGGTLFLHTKYTNWQAQKITKAQGISVADWSRLVAEYGVDEARKQYEALRRTKVSGAGFPRVFFFAVLLIGMYLSVKTRALGRQYVGTTDMKLKIQVDLALTLAAFLLFVVSFVMIRFRMVSEAAYPRWLYAPVILSGLCVLHYFYRPIRRAWSAVWRFMTTPFRRKVVRLEDFGKKGGGWREKRR
jgi:hypothetical protein